MKKNRYQTTVLIREPKESLESFCKGITDFINKDGVMNPQVQMNSQFNMAFIMFENAVDML